MYEWKWEKNNKISLVKFVNKKAIDLLSKLYENSFDLIQNKKGRRKLVETIYNCLIAKNITYAYEIYQPKETEQLIRTPSQILSSPGQGTCLDLALLFCGCCLGYDLLPLLIIIDGHALAAVSLNHNCQNDGWNNPGRRELQLFRKENGEQDLLTGEEKLKELKQLIDDEAYIAIECTGFAHTDSFVNSEEPEAKGRENGFLDFNRALDAGSEQLSNPHRPFQFAIDIALAHYDWGILPLEILIASNTLEQLSAKGEINIDNLEESTVIGNDIDAEKGNYEATINARNSKGLTLTGNKIMNGDEVKKKLSSEVEDVGIDNNVSISPLATYELTKFNFKEDIGKLTEGFVGRQWLFDEIEKWINNKEGQRFFILTGEPGVGKSAIAAQLIKKYKEQYHIAAYHFCTAKESGTIEPNRVLLSLAAQLIDYFPSYAETLINSLKPDLLSVHSEINVKNVKDSVVHGVVFEKLSTRCPQETLDVVLRQPLQKLLKKPGQPFLILIDSLDEAVTRNEENLVALLSKVDDLPSQVRFLYTTRLERRVLSFLENTNAYFYHLAKESEESRNDINQYALKRVDSKEIQEQLRNYQREPEVFVKYLSEPWNGNFLYTKLLLNEIELGLQPLDDLNKLPKDLYGIYHGFLLRIKHEWKRQYRPIVGTLAVTQVPLTQRQISNFTHIKPREIRENLEVLIQFLDVFKENEQADETYTLFHRSFRDYLLDEKRNKDFWCDVKEQHEEIVNYYTAEAKSGYEVDWKKADNYGFLYLPKHLYEAELKQELYELLTSSAKWMEAKFRAFGSDAAYADDLELAIKNFTGLLTSNKLLALVKLYTARQVIHQRVSIYDYNDFTTLVWLGRKEEALSHARLRPDAEDKFKYFITIHNALQEKGEYDPTPLDEAWKVTHQIQTDSKRVRILSRLGVAFAKAKDDKATEVWKEANKVVDTITNKEEKAWALGVLAVALAQAEQFDKAEEVAAKIPDSEYQEMDWSAWAATFAWAGKFDKAKRIADQIQDEKQQAKALSELVTALARGGHIKKAEEIADKFSDPRYQAEALIEIAAALARAGDDKQAAFVKFNEAEKAAATILSDQEWGKVACKLTVALAEAGYPERIKKSVDIIKKDIKDSWEQAETLIELAVAFIPAKNVDVSPIFIKAKEVVDQIQDNSHKAMALSQLAAALAQAGDNKQASEVFSEAGQVSYAIEEDWQQADVMIDVAAVLDRAGRDDVGRVIRKAVEEIAGKIENNWQLQYIQQKLEKARAQAEDAVEVSEVLTSGQVPSMNKDNAEQAEVLEKLATNLDQAGYFTEVKEVACKAIKSGSIRAQTLKELAIALAQAELFSAAEKIADTIEDYSERTETLSELADSLAQSHRWMKAFSVFGLKDRPSLFLAVLVKWKSDFETVEPKLSIAILQEASRIFNWINSDWSQIYKLITSS